MAFTFDRDDTVSVCAVCMLSLVAATSFPAERKNPSAYSKFASAELKTPSSMMLPSRWGMLILYVPSAIVGTWIVVSHSRNAAGNSPLWLRPASALLTIHFWKRVLEVLFVHVYSGSMAVESLFISVVYTTYTWLIASREVGWNDDSNRLQMLCGVAFFVLGTMGNLYHHLLLASLRTVKSSGAKKQAGGSSSSGSYQLPYGGLFDLVVAPHYFFELLAWAGIALTAQTVIALLVTAAMTAYLAARSLNTRDYYRRKFGKKWPEHRRSLIPYVF